ncbi:hypothetical protein PoB_002645900 [Plakobranchus ocellatus]|uniref:Uncharacterized protein n=1 Tax=Plakobranchus ocellatus TaxID=259542 RepID=A0AAV4A175_9GAST|nr:hypothetical protein PoB_002645900 [Plakobranchus ocellatus]
MYFDQRGKGIDVDEDENDDNNNDDDDDDMIKICNDDDDNDDDDDDNDASVTSPLAISVAFVSNHSQVERSTFPHLFWLPLLMKVLSTRATASHHRCTSTPGILPVYP